LSAVSTASDPRIGEEHVIEIAGREFGSTHSQIRMRADVHLKRRRAYSIRAELLVNRIGDFLATVTGVSHTTVRRIHREFATVVRPVIHAVGSRQNSRMIFELPGSR